MDLARNAVRGVMGVSAINGVRYVISFVIQIALARLLTPEIFGIVVMSNAVLSFLMIGSQWGVISALMQASDHEKLFETVFWLRFAYAVLLVGGLVVFAPVLDWFYADVFVSVLVLLGVAKGFQLLGTPFKGVVQRDLNLVRIALTELIALVISSGIALWLALNGVEIWSLAVYYALRDSLTATGYGLLSTQYPGLTYDGGTTRWFLGYARRMLWSRMLATAESQGDDYLVGLFGTATILGIYNVAWRLATASVTVIQPAIRDGIMPTFARLRDSDEQSRRGMAFILRLQLHLLIPLYVAIAVMAPEIILWTFGEQWRGAVPVFQILAVAGVAFPLVSTGRHYYYSQASPQVVVRMQLAYIIVMVLSLAILIPMLGGVGAALAVDATFVFGSGLMLRRLREDIGLDVFELLSPPAISGCVSVAFAVGVRHAVTITSPAFVLVALAGTGMAAGIGYFGTLLTLDQKTVREDVTVIRQALL